MANPEHLKILKQGVEVWNKMWEQNPQIRPDLGQADLRDMNLAGVILNNARLIMADLTGANFQEAKMSNADLLHAKLENTNFTGADLSQTNFGYAKAELHGANFERTVLFMASFSQANLKNSNFNNAHLVVAKLLGANFQGSSFVNADFNRAELNKANFRNAILTNAKLRGAYLSEADFSNAHLEHSRIYGISAWDIKKDNLIQKDLIITPPNEPEITVDDLEVAQFIYLLLNNQNIRNVIDTITSKAVLILGRFDEKTGRKQVLDALKDELRHRNYLPIVFDFDPLKSRNLTETVSILAKMSRFVVADLTDPRSIPQELREIVPVTPSLPIVPIILDSQREYGMFEFFTNYPWVLPIYRYESQASLLENIVPAIIAPAEEKAEALRPTPH